MPIRQPFEVGYYYHIYNRGREKQKLFFKKKEYQKIINTMFYHKRKFRGFKIVSYCFLPNHFHIIVFVSKANREVSKFMETRCGRYARYFTETYGNEKNQHKPKQRVFESNFKSKKIDSYKYLNQCFFYVEQNAVKHKLVDHANDRAYSSAPYTSELLIERNGLRDKADLTIDFFDDREF